MTTKSCKKVAHDYYCENCDYNTSRKSSYDKHLTTTKHLNTTYDYKKLQKVANEFICDCGNKYKHHSSLWKHQNKCNIIMEYENDDEIHNAKEEKENENQNKKSSQLEIITNMFKEQLKENKELKDLVLEQNKKILELFETGKMVNNITNTNCNNKTKFNLNLFLNEQCKDALNLTDFVNDLQIQLIDLENVGRLGYTEGISKIFINGLKQLDVSKRPIHCSDYKREVLYVKDQDAWERDNEENKKIKKAIHHISHKNIQQIQKWTEQHPHCKESDSKQNDQYLQILCESMGSAEPSNLDKVIHNIAKEVVIEK